MLGRFPRRAVLIGAVAALTALVAATVAQAQLVLKPATDDEALITRSGQTIAIDAKTGRIRPPTREEAVALAQQMLGQYSHSVAPVIQTSSSGMMWVNLPEEFQDVMVLRLLPDGTSSVECVHGPGVADDMVLRGDVPQADCNGAPAIETLAEVPAVAPAAAVEKPSTPAATSAAAASARPKSIRKSAKPASVSTVRR
jgi:hypothetical protein